MGVAGHCKGKEVTVREIWVWMMENKNQTFSPPAFKDSAVKTSYMVVILSGLFLASSEGRPISF